VGRHPREVRASDRPNGREILPSEAENFPAIRLRRSGRGREDELEDLGHLRTAARALLDEASPGAREEWMRFEDRFPSDVEIRRGFIALSKPELEEMWSKVRPFRDILAAGRRRGPKLSRVGTDRAQSDGGGGGNASPAVPSSDVQLDIGVARQE
jgi:hypothetical protein